MSVHQKKVAIGEAAAVLVVLATTAFIGGAKISDWTSSLAVFIGFVYSQLCFDIAEVQAQIHSPLERLRSLFVLKELVWILTFFLLGSWPLLCGAIMFSLYPTIRSLIRKNTA